MFDLTKWFEREFPYEPPQELFPTLVERLRGAPVRVEEHCATTPPAILTIRDGEDWSFQEHIGHLWDLESLWLGRIEDFLAGEAVLRAADLTNAKTYEAEHNSRKLVELTDGFRQSRSELVDRLEKMSPEEAASTSLHPRLQQPMRVIDLCFFVAEHDDHHLAIMTRLRSKLG